jgi:stage III sporulation protein AE
MVGCAFSCVACIVARAEGDDSVEGQLNQNIQEQIDNLDLDALEEYVASLGNFSNESLSDRLISYIQTGGTDYEGIWKQIKTILFSKITEILPAFACITAITLLSGFISMLKSGSNSRTTSDMIFLITYAAALIPILAVLSECFRLSVNGVRSMQTHMQLIFPLILTLMAATGGTVTAAVCRPAVAFFTNNIVTVVHSVIFPITGCILVLSMATNLTKELKIGKFTAFFKSINKWIVGICISAFGIFFTLQGITAANYDGIVRRAAKYAIGNGIPIVGGFLSGGFDLAVAGSILIKNALGSMSIFLMLAVVFEPLVLLVSVNILLRLTAAITQPFGDGRISDFLEETAGNLHYCTAGLLFTAFLYFLSIMLMVCASEALF